MIDETEKKVKDLMSTENDIESIDQMVKDEIKTSFNHQCYQSTEQKELMKRFYVEDPVIETDIIKYHDHTKNEDLNEMIILMNTNITNVVQRRMNIQSCLEKIEEDLVNHNNELATMKESIHNLEKQMNEMKIENDRRAAEVGERNKEKGNLQHQWEQMDAEKKTLEQKIERESQTNISDQEKIQKYINGLQTESITGTSVDIADRHSESDETQEAQRLLKFLQHFEENNLEIEKQLTKFQKMKSVKEDTIQEYKKAEIEIEAEEKLLTDINNNIKEKKAELNDLLAKKSLFYNDNELLKTILNPSSSNVEDKTLLEQLRQNMHDLNERITQISDALRSMENEYDENNQLINTLDFTLKTEKAKGEILHQTIKDLTERRQIVDELRPSLMNTEEKLN
ncbi:unnamed protein product [Rotaria sp. Silwood2]|nr:unnamed protein product [Rotaria sp. Silwood2]